MIAYNLLINRDFLSKSRFVIRTSDCFDGDQSGSGGIDTESDSGGGALPQWAKSEIV
jgi:hypothetical protein